MSKYIGMDVHTATTTVAVLDERGQQIMDVTLKTEAATLVQFLRGLSGSLYVTLEEGTFAAWLADVLTPHVDRLVVANPRRNALLKQGNKSDRIDARKLAQLLRAGLLSPVYHQLCAPALKELAQSYLTVVRDATRVMNRLKALYRARGLACAGTRVYSRAFRQQWFQQLPAAGVQPRAGVLYAQLDLLLGLRQQARRALLTEARKYAAQKILRTIPGLGPVRVALLLALLQTPHRFRSKRQLWSYAGLGVVTRSSAQYQMRHGQIVPSRKPTLIRGLNPEHHRELKAIFKGAALVASHRPGPLRDFYQARIAQQKPAHLVRLTLARKIAALVLALWKKGESYDAEHLSSPTLQAA